MSKLKLAVRKLVVFRLVLGGLGIFPVRSFAVLWVRVLSSNSTGVLVSGCK